MNGYTIDHAKSTTDQIMPPLMNIFIEPKTMSFSEFGDLASCLVVQRSKVDAALAALPHQVPARDQQFVHPLHLGGVAWGQIPYLNVNYLAELATRRSAATIPEEGRFFVFPDHSVEAEIGGRKIKVAVSKIGEPSVLIDGTVSKNWRFEDHRCDDATRDCLRGIMHDTDAGDTSQRFSTVRMYMLRKASNQK